MIQTLCSVLMLIQAQAASAQAAIAQAGSVQETAADEASEPASVDDVVELYQLKVTALGLGPSVVIPENLSDGQVILAELSKNTDITWKRQIVTPVVPNTKLEWHTGEQTPVVTGQTVSGRGGGQPIRNYSNMNTGTILSVSELKPCECGVALQFQFESSRLDRSSAEPGGSIDSELQTQMQQCQFRGTLMVPEKKTIVIQASQSAANGNEVPGHVLIFVSVEKHP